MYCNKLMYKFNLTEFVQQNLMNKLNTKQLNILLPLNHPSPDHKNKNRVIKTSSPTQQVKKYLQSIKNTYLTNEVQNSSRVLSNISDSEDQRQVKSNQDMMRRRISQLEMQNNQFRIFVREYENLVVRNRQLEDQMLILLQQLEQRGNNSSQSQKYATQQQDTRRRQQNSTKDALYLTTQSSQSKTLRKSLQNSSKQNNDSNQIQNIQPFNSITIDSKYLVDQNTFLKIENQRIKQLVNQQIKESIQSLEAKFANLMSSMQQKINQLNIFNQESVRRQLKISLKSDSKKSSEENRPIIKLNNQKMDQKDKVSNKWGRSSHNSQFQQNSQLYPNTSKKQLNLNPARRSQKQIQFKKNQSKNSLVNIQGSCLSQSNQSFGKSNQKHSSAKQDSNLFRNIQCVEHQHSQNLSYEKIIIDRIWENLRNLRSNLIYILGEASKIKQTIISDSYELIEKELRQLLGLFFAKNTLSTDQIYSSKKRVEQMKKQQLLNECLQMRQKIKDLNEQIIKLQQDLKIKLQQQLSSSPYSSTKQIKVASQSYLQNEYYQGLKPETVQFQETKNRLEDIIRIMRSFNEQYQNILGTYSSRVFLLNSDKKAA